MTTSMSGAVVQEYDEADRLVGTYVESSTKKKRGENLEQQRRVGFIVPENPKAWYQIYILDVFLPAGYPHSVTEDYLWYQIYDSLQAFASSIAGLLSNRAVLEGVGVGDSTATPTNALLMSIIQETGGRVATILFAHRLGTSLEPECKMYRLLADIFNDTAMILDCLSPAFPKKWRVVVLAGSSILRALCGVSAGSSKASLSAHFAKRDNLGELNAKDSSQETIISLVGMLCGTLTVSYVTTPFWTWITLLVLLMIHVYTNYLAVRSVSMRTLNRQRLNLLASSEVLSHDNIPLSPAALAKSEHVFEWPGVLRLHGHKIGWAVIGARMDALVKCIAECGHDEQGILGKTVWTSAGARSWFEGTSLRTVLRLYAQEPYILWWSVHRRQAVIVLKRGSTVDDQIRAWIQALMVAQWAASEGWGVGEKKTVPLEELTDGIESTLNEIKEKYSRIATAFKLAGWDFETNALETGDAYRTVVEVPENSHGK